MTFRFDWEKYQPLYTPLAILAGCLLIAVVIYTSGGITITIGGGRVAGEGEDNFDSFTKCLTERGAKLYASSGCGYCQQQKELFGASLEYLDFVDCDVGYAEGEECQEAEIESVPTWIFEDGSKAIGVQTLEALSEKTGCSLQ